MTNTTKGIGMFTTGNIVAIMRAIPETNGTYLEITIAAETRGASVNPHTIAKWIQKGKSDIRDKNFNTAYARFAKKYAKLVKNNCGPDENRSRELDEALRILDETCECGKAKQVFPDGNTAEACRQCLETEHGLEHRGRSSNQCQRCKGQTQTTPDGPQCMQCGHHQAKP